jgi:hypothetical protein
MKSRRQVPTVVLISRATIDYEEMWPLATPSNGMSAAKQFLNRHRHTQSLIQIQLDWKRRFVRIADVSVENVTELLQNQSFIC